MIDKIIAQSIGIVAMVVAISSFQQRTQKRIVLFQLVSSVLFCTHFLMIGALTGGILNGIGMVRAAIFAKRDTKRWAASPVWIYIFTGIFIVVYGLNFTVFGVAPTWQNFVLELLPVLGMVATTVAFRMEKAAHVRVLSLISSPLWLVYNVLQGSLGGVLTESFSLTSIVIGMVRLDIQTKDRPAK